MLLSHLAALFAAHPFAQSVGFCAAGIGMLAFTQRDPQRLRRFMMFYSLLIGSHYFLLGSVPAATSTWICCLRNIVALRKRRTWIMCLFLLLVWIVGIAQITAPIQWLAILGTTLGTIAVFRENGTQMRLLMLSSSCCWVIHNLVIGSIGGAFIEGSFMLVNGSFLLRFARTRPCPANHS